jgi:hypothetical protein
MDQAKMTSERIAASTLNTPIVVSVLDNRGEILGKLLVVPLLQIVTPPRASSRAVVIAHSPHRGVREKLDQINTAILRNQHHVALIGIDLPVPTV